MNSILRSRIFLSHKTVDKAMVRDYKATLAMLGLQPWLDEDDLPAGAELHRAIQKGMKESCAAVFFITPAYSDDKFLRAEINYAVAEKTERGDAFSIITLVFPGGKGVVSTVPELLEPFVWKPPPTSQLQGLREILRALPAPFRDIRPSAEVTAEPQVQVVVTPGQLVAMGLAGRPASAEDVVMVKLENHGDRPVFVGGGLSFKRDDSDNFFWIGTDATRANLYKRTVEPGDGFTVTIPAAALDEHRDHIVNFFFSDEIGRRFWSDPETTKKALLER